MCILHGICSLDTLHYVTLCIQCSMPHDSMSVQAMCIATGQFAITEVSTTESFPATVPKNGVNFSIDYLVDPNPLLDNSQYCWQHVW